MQLHPDATFDSLVMATNLQRGEGTFAAAELHLFGYLACLLWLYRERTLADWGYSFVGTELGAPFSPELDGAMKALIDRGYFLRAGDRMSVSPVADEQLDDFRALDLNAERVECLTAACSSTAAFSAGMVGSALAQEPELKRARAMPISRPLLEDAAQTQLYQQFDALREGLEKRDLDLRVPAIVWLTALYRSDAPTEP